MNIEKKREFIINALYYAIIFVGLYFVFKYAIAWLFPFILAFIFVSILQAIIVPVKRLMHTKNEKIAIIVLLIIYLSIGLLIGYISFRFVVFSSNTLTQLPKIIDIYITPTIAIFSDWVQNAVGGISPQLLAGVQEFESTFINILGSLGSSVSSFALTFLKDFVSAIPNFLLSTLILIISSFFIAIDYNNINEVFLNQCPKRVQLLIQDIKEYIVNTLSKIIVAYAKILTVTFIEISIGLLLLQVPKAILIAALIAMLDILPAIGTGGIMIPWAIYALINGDITLGIGLIILYVFITIVRNIIEPKIVGNQVGIHPLITLMGMFAGVKIFGVMGIFLGPIILIVIIKLNEAGKIKIFKIKTEEEE